MLAAHVFHHLRWHLCQKDIHKSASKYGWPYLEDSSYRQEYGDVPEYIHCDAFLKACQEYRAGHRVLTGFATPRRTDAAAKPVKSPITPPPTAKISESRLTPFSISHSTTT